MDLERVNLELGPDVPISQLLDNLDAVKYLCSCHLTGNAVTVRHVHHIGFAFALDSCSHSHSYFYFRTAVTANQVKRLSKWEERCKTGHEKDTPSAS
ncbi:uncharacterized protein ARMOST_22349 [Armillaria ostoyae]|uniref:Uncharacterized protein n=1 Tax=Armillaria ostoyae TaxID=47428 RepID=A0A284SCM8_ARMOS|nr:uncharacterized protein ARMOST_22349 [Armillaria ostoyae]